MAGINPLFLRGSVLRRSTEGSQNGVTMIETPYGAVSGDEHDAEVSATRLQLWDWAHRTGSSWPCSALATYDEVSATFIDGDLVELRVIDNGFDSEAEDLGSDELNAWSSDVLKAAGFENHPVLAPRDPSVERLGAICT